MNFIRYLEIITEFAGKIPILWKARKENFFFYKRFLAFDKNFWARIKKMFLYASFNSLRLRNQLEREMFITDSSDDPATTAEVFDLESFFALGALPF